MYTDMVWHIYRVMESKRALLKEDWGEIVWGESVNELL
jgi:hypothetical protein